MNTYTLDPALREQFRERSDWRGALSVLQDYTLLVLAFALSILWPHPLSWLVSVFLLSGVHAGFAILTHEASHRSLFASSRLNEWVGQYLCAAPIYSSVSLYRAYHMTHHRHAGTRLDPDLVMVERYPIPKARLRRKLLRDISGRSGIRFFIGSIGMLAGYWKFQQNGLAERVAYDPPMRFLDHLKIFARNGGLHALAWQGLLWGVLFALGHGALYLLWLAAYFFLFPLFMRVRQLADHAAVHDPLSTNALDHARTTRAGWLARLLMMPHHESYHLEHHLMPAAPHWNLPKLHQVLVKEGVIPPANQASGIFDVLRRVSV